MIDYAGKNFSHDPNGEGSLPLPAWIIEMKVQNYNGMDLCQGQVSPLIFD